MMLVVSLDLLTTDLQLRFSLKKSSVSGDITHGAENATGNDVVNGLGGVYLRGKMLHLDGHVFTCKKAALRPRAAQDDQTVNEPLLQRVAQRLKCRSIPEDKIVSEWMRARFAE